MHSFCMLVRLFRCAYCFILGGRVSRRVTYAGGGGDETTLGHGWPRTFAERPASWPQSWRMQAGSVYPCRTLRPAASTPGAVGADTWRSAHNWSGWWIVRRRATEQGLGSGRSSLTLDRAAHLRWRHNLPSSFLARDGEARDSSGRRLQSCLGPAGGVQRIQGDARVVIGQSMYSDVTASC